METTLAARGHLGDMHVDGTARGPDARAVREGAP